MDRNRIATRILASLESKPGLKASEISLRLQIEKKDINSVLYDELKNKVVKDDEYRWYSKVSAEINVTKSEITEDKNLVSDTTTSIDHES